jgi:hypothetical protein
MRPNPPAPFPARLSITRIFLNKTKTNLKQEPKEGWV